MRSAADAAGERTAQRFLKVAAAERKKRFRIGKKEACGEFVGAAVEFAIPVRGELVVGVLAGTADGKGAGRGIAAGNQVAVGSAAELVALEIEQAYGDWVQAGDAGGKSAWKELGDQGSFRAAGGLVRKRGNGGADEGARRETATLASALIVDKEVAKLLLADGTAQAAAKNILLHGRARLALAIQKEFVGVENVVAEKLVGIAVILAGAGLENSVDVAAAVAALAGVVERCLHLEFLNDVGIGQRNVGGLGDVVVSGGDSVDQVVVVIFALAVDKQLHRATAELGGGVKFALRAGGKSQELLIVLRSKRQFADGLRAQGLASGGVGGFHAGDFRDDFDFIGNAAGFERDDDSCSFGDADFDTFRLGLREAGLVHDDVVAGGRQKSGDEGSVSTGGKPANDGFGSVIDDLNVGISDGGAGRIYDLAADSAGCAALTKNWIAGEQ